MWLSSLTIATLHITATHQLSISSLLQRSSRRCEDISLPKLPDIQVLSISSAEVLNYDVSVPAVAGVSQTTNGTIDFCNITITVTHPGAEDKVIIGIWLPLNGWNGRFLATGGGGLVAGAATNLPAPVFNGWAAGYTDAGLGPNANSGAWAIKTPGVLNVELVKNFAFRSIHDLTVVSKAAIKTLYGKKPHHSYYNGCSTGGRQGYFAAQHYPKDFDGIVAIAPALYTPEVSPGLFWPSVVMGNSVAPPKCVFDAYNAAIVAACDSVDGATDGLVGEPDKCTFDTTVLVGKTIDCAETKSVLTITTAYADVVAKVIQGPRSRSGEWLWYGLPLGASFSGIAGTKTTDNITAPVPFGSAEAWIRNFVLLDPNATTASLTIPEFESAYRKSVATFTRLMGTRNPDLAPFQKYGRKLLTWHGLADQYLTHEGSVQYRKSLEESLGKEKVDSFHKLFLAPGAAHCSGGVGPIPTDPLGVMVKWVESGIAPETLFAATLRNGSIISRKLCAYPKSLRYRGSGDLSAADSFICTD